MWSQLKNKGYSIFYSILICRQKILMAVFVAVRWFFVFLRKRTQWWKVHIGILFSSSRLFFQLFKNLFYRPGRRSQCRLKKAEKENIGKRRSWFFYFTWYLPKNILLIPSFLQPYTMPVTFFLLSSFSNCFTPSQLFIIFINSIVIFQFFLLKDSYIRLTSI